MSNVSCVDFDCIRTNFGTNLIEAKMNFAGNFRHIGNIDISAIKDEVEKLTDDDWNEQSWRQKRYEVHKDTKFIGLVYDPDFRHANSTRHPALEKFKK